METFTVEQKLGTRLQKIDDFITSLESKPTTTYNEYKELEEKLNEIQQGIDVTELQQFELRMSKLWERVKDKPE